MISTYTVVGNLASQPELKTTKTGRSVTRVRIASNPVSRRADGELVKHEPVFLPVELWGDLAERFCQLEKGAAVIVVGEFRASPYKTEAGENRTHTYIRATAGGPDLAWMNVAGASRPVRSSSTQSAGQQPGPAATSTPAAEEPPEEFDIDAALGDDPFEGS